ncbi:CobW family GTP-binding protein [Marinibacterium sp. SX1]|uniref:CobW family GTP-binding protein n=1 Tax=Marinibacterium sp. SX1 TaxID=3388424 RepID=UPI003D186A1B
MMRLPLTIISGYLGAGKTTLINRLLAEDHGLKLMILVNDFGAINIDDALISARGDDTIALTNGCVCCTMDTDLFKALNQVLDSPDRPDHLIIEASGIADPVAIAQALRGEPELGYAGIVTPVDGQNIDALLDDPLVAPQVTQQITGADLILLTKTTELDTGLAARLQSIGARPPMLAGAAPLSDLLFDLVPLPRGATPAAHPAYAAWQHDSDRVLDRRALGEKLENRPAGLYRLKGFVLTGDGAYEIHCVGRFLEARRTSADRTTLVGLGPADRISPDEIEAWWAA